MDNQQELEEMKRFSDFLSDPNGLEKSLDNYKGEPLILGGHILKSIMESVKQADIPDAFKLPE